MEKIKYLFNEKQLKLMESAGIKLKDKLYSDDEIIDISDSVADYFQVYGIGKNDVVNETGIICESIMDIFGVL